MTARNTKPVDARAAQAFVADVFERSIVRTLVEAGAGVEAVETEEPSLEDVYIKLLAGGGSA